MWFYVNMNTKKSVGYTKRKKEKKRSRRLTDISQTEKTVDKLTSSRKQHFMFVKSHFVFQLFHRSIYTQADSKIKHVVMWKYKLQREKETQK